MKGTKKSGSVARGFNAELASGNVLCIYHAHVLQNSPRCKAIALSCLIFNAKKVCSAFRLMLTATASISMEGADVVESMSGERDTLGLAS